ncbi:MAG: hypothetical protein IJH32_10680 [Ruminococcus sp.]|nr:hypothetical protein [Ruminococcus sp.]
MQFPNAAKGIKKIFSSVILDIIGGVGLVISALVVLAVAAMLESGDESLEITGMIAVITMAVSGVLTLLAAVLSVVGMAQASKDEGSFKIAIFVLIAAVVTSVLSIILREHQIMYNIVLQITDLLHLIVIIYVIQGMINLADALGEPGIIKSGKHLFIMITIIYGLTCLANIIVAIFGGQTASLIAGVIAFLAEALGLVQSIVYIVFLSRAKKMLNR